MSIAAPISACRENSYLMDAFSLSSESSSSVLDRAVGYGSTSSTPLSATSSVGGAFGGLSNRRMRMVYDSNLPRDQLIAMKRARKRQLNRESAQRVREKRKLESNAFETQLRATRMALDVARKQLAEILAERNELRRRLACYENPPSGQEFLSNTSAGNNVTMDFGTTVTSTSTTAGEGQQFKPLELNNILGGSIFLSGSVTPSSSLPKAFSLANDNRIPNGSSMCGVDGVVGVGGALEELKESGIRGDSIASSSAITNASYGGNPLDRSAAWNTFAMA